MSLADISGRAPGTTRSDHRALSRRPAVRWCGCRQTWWSSSTLRMDSRRQGLSLRQSRRRDSVAYDLAGHPSSAYPPTCCLAALCAARIPYQPIHLGLMPYEEGEREAAKRKSEEGIRTIKIKGRRRCPTATWRWCGASATPDGPGIAHMHRCERRLRNAGRGDPDVPGSSPAAKYFEQPVEGIARMAQSRPRHRQAR